MVKIEISWNTIEDDSWYDLGISYQKAKYHKLKRVFTIALVVFSIYIRF